MFVAATAAALMLGAVVGAFVDVPRPVRATLLAFASGALLTALAFELFEEAHRDAGILTASLALLAGAATFIVADWLLQRFVGGAGAVGLALVAAVTLDGVPENLALGVTLSHGGSYALLVALIASNFPEALGGAMSIRESGRSPAFAIAAWGATAVLLALALFAGRVLAVGAPEDVVAIALAFAAGAVLASLADTLMPEAYKEGGPLVAFATTAGFLLSYAIASS